MTKYKVSQFRIDSRSSRRKQVDPSALENLGIEKPPMKPLAVEQCVSEALSLRRKPATDRGAAR